MSGKRALLWIAVSSKQQAEEDKISLKFQEDQARQWCIDNGYTVVGVLSVPGHSRSESDILTLLDDYAAAGVYAYHNLRRAWQEKSFDVLVAYSLDRLARSGTMLSYVVENTVKSGATLYLLEDGGMITEEDFRFKMAFGSISVVSSFEQFHKKAKVARRNRVSSGLPASGFTVWSHILERTPTGKSIRLTVDESKRRLFDDLATLIIEGVSWRQMEDELFTRFGHGDNGKKFYFHFGYNLVHNPYFWGHSAIGFSDVARNGGQSKCFWLYDAREEIPPHIQVFWNTHEAVYVGEQAAEVKAALLRRRSISHGKASSATAAKFAGLVLCGHCGFLMTRVSNQSGNAYYRCRSHMYAKDSACTKARYIREEKIHDHINTMLSDLLASGNYHLVQPEVDYSARMQQLREEITTTETRITRLIQKQADAPVEATALYDDQIRQYSEQLRALKNALAETEAAAQSATDQNAMTAFDMLKEATLERFWTWDVTKINRLLHRLFGQWKVATLNKEVIGLAKQPKNGRNKSP